MMMIVSGQGVEIRASETQTRYSHAPAVAATSVTSVLVFKDTYIVGMYVE